MAKGEPRGPQKPAAANKPPATDKPVMRKPPLTRPARTPKASTGPLTSRTATVDDPLTTSLLAEIARRPSTVEVSPEQLAEIMDIARGDRDPDDST